MRVTLLPGDVAVHLLPEILSVGRRAEFGRASFQGLRRTHLLATLTAAVLATFFSACSAAQATQNEEVKPVPLLTGSAGLVTFFDGGEPHLAPIIAPVLVVPVGQRWLFESRATFESDMVQLPGQGGFHGKVEKEVDYAQLD